MFKSSSTRSFGRMLARSLILAAVMLALVGAFRPSQAAASRPSVDSAVHVRLSHTVNVLKPTPTPTTEPEQVTNVSFTFDGGWLVLHGKNGYSSKGIDTAVTDELDKLNTDGKAIQWVAFSPDGGWVINSDAGFTSLNLPKDFHDKLTELNTTKKLNVKWATFTADGGWVFLVGDNGYSAKGVPQGATDELDKLNAKAKTVIMDIAFTADNDWVVLYDANGYAWSTGIDSQVTDKLKEINDAGTDLRQIVFTNDKITTDKPAGWLILSGKHGVDGLNLPVSLVDKITQLEPSVVATTPTPTP